MIRTTKHQIILYKNHARSSLLFIDFIPITTSLIYSPKSSTASLISFRGNKHHLCILMMPSSIRPNILGKNLPYFSRNSAITAVPQLHFSKKSPSSPPEPIIKSSEPIIKSNPIFDVNNTKELFTSVSTSKLIKSAVTLHMAAIESMVDVGTWVMESKLMHVPPLRKVVLGAIEHSFYEHFCAGKDLNEAYRTVGDLRDAGLGAMLDYGMEHANDNESCEQNLAEFVQTIESTKLHPTSPVSFVVVKITAICPPRLLKRVSDLLRWECKDKSLHLPWKLETFQIFSDSTPLYHTSKRPPPLTIEEESDLQVAYQRLTKICKKSLELNVPILIDAEDTTIQPAIDYFTYSAAMQNHRDDKPLIFNTIQAYLKDAKERLVMVKKAADKTGVPMGFKLVRGAYMSNERRVASSLGVKSPIHESISDTHACYNECAAFLLQQIANGSGSVVLATHNLESGKQAVSRAIDLGIMDSQDLQFAQLYGMAEALSFGLRNAGFRVSKYLPFGPVDQIIPYLLRRAEENRGLLSASSLDRHLMRKELYRRLTSRTC